MSITLNKLDNNIGQLQFHFAARKQESYLY